MNPALKALQDKLKAKSGEAQTLFDKNDKSADDVTAAKALVEECKSIKSEIETLLSADAAQAELSGIKSWATNPGNTLPVPGAPAAAGSDGHATKTAGVTEIDLLTGKVVSETGLGVLSTPQMKATANPQYLKAYADFLRAGGDMAKVKSADARKFLSEGIDAEGGALVPAEMLSGILQREPAPTRILDLVQGINVSSDRAQMLKSTYNSDDLYASAVRVYKTGEGAAATATDKPQFGTLSIDVHSFTAELSISRQLLEDTAFDIVGYITNQFRIACRNFAADKVLNGSGVGEHHGILQRAGKANGPDIVKTGSAAAITWGGLRSIKNAVPEQYDQNAHYVFNKRSTQDVIEALVDADGRPLWPESQRSGLESGTPGTLQGYSFIREAFMPDVAANALPLIFGDLGGYIRALRLGMAIEQLREIEARRGQVVFLARFREGGDVAEPWRLKVQKVQV